MPSTLVHVSVGAVVATALLGDDTDLPALVVVLGAVAFVDLDAFVGLVLPGAHRSLFHSVLFPLVLVAFLLADARRSGSVIRARYGADGVRVGLVAVVAVLVGGILPDLVTNGVNLLYPLHDAFYTVNGELLLSNQRGVVQTFVDRSPDGPARTTRNLHYSTGVDPSPRAEPEDVERVFPLVSSGLELLIVLLGALAVAARLGANARR